MDSGIDFKNLWAEVERNFVLGKHSFHGPGHWQQVEQNGLLLAGLNGADKTIVRLFAAFHDSCRESEGYDPEHGRRAAALLTTNRGSLFEIDDDLFAELHFAISHHNDGTTTDDLNIGTCWDGDRMDLPRVGITPVPSKMNTFHGKQFAALGADQFDDEFLNDD
ncbi:MAG: hypothetical protein AAF456_23325 [Planctomycetota bacterium]